MSGPGRAISRCMRTLGRAMVIPAHNGSVVYCEAACWFVSAHDAEQGDTRCSR